jgi:hypothetical protein
VLFVTDGTAALTDADLEALKLLRRAGRSVIYIANKADSAARALNAQRYASIQNLAVMDMRVSLATSTACVAGAVPAASGAASGALASLSYMQTCSTLTPTISAAGAIATTSLSRTESLATSTSAASTGLFGGDGVIRFGP